MTLISKLLPPLEMRRQWSTDAVTRGNSASGPDLRRIWTAEMTTYMDWHYPDYSKVCSGAG